MNREKLDGACYRQLKSPQPLDYILCYNPMSGYPSAIATRFDCNLRGNADGHRWRVTFRHHREFTLVKESLKFEVVGFTEMFENSFSSVAEAAEFIRMALDPRGLNNNPKP